MDKETNGNGHKGVSEGRIGEEGMGEGVKEQFEETDDEDLYFAPEKNNVIFASAIDGWAFTVRQFAAIYEKKLGIKRSILEKVLWGDFYLDPKTKKVLGQKHLKGRNLEPIFVQLVLKTIWTVYEAAIVGNDGKGDPVLLEKVTNSLGIALPAHIVRSRDPKAILQAVFAGWLPLSTALLVSVIEYLPSAPAAQAARLPELIDEVIGSESIDAKLRDAMINSSTAADAPVVAYVSKMVAVPESELPKARREGGKMTSEEAQAMARKKRAEIAKAQAEAEGVNGITNGLSGTNIGEDEHECRTTRRPRAFDRLREIVLRQFVSGR